MGAGKRMDDTKKMIGSILSFLSLSVYSSGYRNSFKWRRLLGRATSSRGSQFQLRPGNGGSICAEIGDRVVGLSGHGISEDTVDSFEAGGREEGLVRDRRPTVM